MSSEAISAIPAPYSRRDLVKWWEAGRVRFNLWVGSVGVVTWLLVQIVGSLAVKPGEDFEEPIMMIIGPVIYGVMANICFSVSLRPTASVIRVSNVMDCCHERRDWSGSSSSEPRGDCACGKFVPSERFGA